ncbi:hypothetical protein CH72_3147 [Burkholderia ambifaria AMMD]|uniref:Uncharacterized protein n=1 Tax=Burkholderia ambifaria (strain ATCC BAA-244 / DSM 16087 / CCUG 44356 / LMG 19182 / AMMD) TaxID=339670 RepID=Q0BF50_BURCM|nr:DUF2975 domain-containing protein [Burkholderia ambifaria]ABI87223.1 conserved hypothetical protein [Burkholderia ambifaria AMMD]AJY21257.1 hypothetical protein CH72_3147 [Burkholderia ambifaria AMMD]MBR7928711.1 DUF2975 domain-containing protein [Burkholderia ambifaria]PEH65559.1 DUF2975 domain-containing protein [Burkholderia ambifaria]QQC05559.1 DUF2975 domain-containing protein [Burkholderia ambifaria]
MHSDRIARISQQMATVTLGFIVGMLVLNAACWAFPSLNGASGPGLVFGLTDSVISNLRVDVAAFPWWQKAVGILLSSVPLIALANGLRHLRALFRTYARRDYFSVQAAGHLGQTGRAIGLWVLLSLLCEPLLSMWATLREPVGHHVVTIGFSLPYVVALFTAACIAVIAHILRQASELDAEHRQFV